LTYQDLRKHASERQVNSSGTKEDIIARLQEADAAGTNSPENPDSSEPTAPAANDRDVDRAWKKDALTMKEHLAKQPKVQMLIPFDPGVKPEVADKIPFVVNINGYRMEIKRGEYVELPMQVAEIVRERLVSEGKIGANQKVQANPERADALA